MIELSPQAMEALVSAPACCLPSIRARPTPRPHSSTPTTGEIAASSSRRGRHLVSGPWVRRAGRRGALGRDARRRSRSCLELRPDVACLGDRDLQPARVGRRLEPPERASRSDRCSAGRMHAPPPGAPSSPLHAPDARELVRSRTGLSLDPMFSAPEDALGAGRRRRSRRGRRGRRRCSAPLTPGSSTSLTGEHATDAGNASRTLLLNIAGARVGRRAARALRNPRAAVCPRSGVPTQASASRSARACCPAGIPVVAVLADSHAAPLPPRVHGPGRGQGHLRHRFVDHGPRGGPRPGPRRDRHDGRLAGRRHGDLRPGGQHRRQRLGPRLDGTDARRT